MAKKAKQYLDIDPWIIQETGFHPDRSEASESIFAAANEFMGTRGYFEEGFSGPSMPGNYFNGIYENGKHQYSTRFNGFAEGWTYMVNAVDWLHTRIQMDGENLDLATVKFDSFVRRVDMRRGVLGRSFVWHTRSGKQLRLTFERFLSMADSGVGAQRMRFEPLNFSGAIDLTVGLDFGTLYHLRQTRPWALTRHAEVDGWSAGLGKTKSSGHRVFSAFKIAGDRVTSSESFVEGRLIGRKLTLSLTANQVSTLEKTVVHHTEKDTSLDDGAVWKTGMQAVADRAGLNYSDAEAAHVNYWVDVWAHLDILIEGDDENQQGFRYCIFHMHQTYHGADSRFNIGAKGLTGEHYWGVTWWDTETYCLPFYLFNNRKAALNLIDYRYRTLPGAKTRAMELHQSGARYPMCTIDGEETCDVWQHGDLEIHVSSAVAYGVWKYHHITGDDDFLFGKGAEMLIEIARFYAGRGGWGQKSGCYGYWGVMGPDEMHAMVNNNAYTNHMAKKSFEWALDTLSRMENECPDQLQALNDRLDLQPGEPADWRRKADAMELMLDVRSGIYEQHEGFFNMPHIDYAQIPDNQFPVQKNWPYVDLFRYDLIKQADVLQLFFLLGTEFDLESLRKNFGYYEPRCSHESSLSPAIHSILAARLGENQKAFEYSRYASRLDLDDYNNNTSEGLHITSMAGAWMNLVYGFGGLQSDGERLRFTPCCPEQWTAFSFRLYVTDTDILTIRVDHQNATFTMNPDATAKIDVFGTPLTVTDKAISVPIKPSSEEAATHAVIFDLDGVIVSTDAYHHMAWKRLADEMGIEFTKEDNDQCRGVSRMESLEIVLKKSTREYSAAEKEDLAERKNAYYIKLLERITPADILPGVEKLLMHLEARGIQTAIGSSSRNTPMILKRIGMTDRFDAVADGNDITRSKPDPEVFLLAAGKLGVHPCNCLVIEDADSGVDAALAAGMKCLAVSSARDHPDAHFRAVGLADASLMDFQKNTGGGVSKTRCRSDS